MFLETIYTKVSLNSISLDIDIHMGIYLASVFNMMSRMLTLIAEVSVSFSRMEGYYMVRV